MFGRRLKEPFHLMVGVCLKKRIQVNESAFLSKVIFAKSCPMRSEPEYMTNLLLFVER